MVSNLFNSSGEFLAFGYCCAMAENEPWKYPQEEEYFRSVQNKCIFEDNT
jgi:hypothetical protein